MENILNKNLLKENGSDAKAEDIIEAAEEVIEDGEELIEEDILAEDEEEEAYEEESEAEHEEDTAELDIAEDGFSDDDELDNRVESEEVLEVALADNKDEAPQEEYVLAQYTDGEMSGLTDAQRKRKEIFDKITTGLLILLMASPVLIILYIFLWFIFKP